MAPWPAGFERVELAETDSTNAEALRRAANGETGPVWIRADRQNGGRGRRGHVWQSVPGNLFATLLMRPQRPEKAQLSFVAALAASDLLAGYAPTAEIRLKWPNDVLAEGAKIVGILLEADATGDALAIGIGVNLIDHPPLSTYPATSLAALDATVPAPTEALTELAVAFERWYAIWLRQGFAPIRAAWLARVVGLGGHIRVHLSEGNLDGVFEGVDEGGRLLLRHSDGSATTISAGDVFFS